VSSWDLKVLAAWVELLDLAGQVSEKLYVRTAGLRSGAEADLNRNTNTCFQDQIDYYMVALRRWESNLDPTISWFPNAPPGLYQLRYGSTLRLSKWGLFADISVIESSIRPW